MPLFISEEIYITIVTTCHTSHSPKSLNQAYPFIETQKIIRPNKIVPHKKATQKNHNVLVLQPHHYYLVCDSVPSSLSYPYSLLIHIHLLSCSFPLSQIAALTHHGDNPYIFCLLSEFIMFSTKIITRPHKIISP